MKNYIVLALCAPVIVGCATTGPATSWGKENVSMEDYRMDAAVCAAVAAGQRIDDNAANTAGGISGKNASGSSLPQQAGGVGSGTPSGAATPVGGGGAYRESASADFVSRAAQQQRTQELAAQRAKVQALHSCLSNRGYTEFRLTPEQRQHLATLPEGSDERRAFLHKLGSDPEVLKANRVSPN